MDTQILHIYKPIGWTPLDVIKTLRLHPDFKNAKMSYAGRLDPMAEGVLLVLVGDETKNQEKYQSLHKEYVAEILFGFSTDSYDLLGMVTDYNPDVSITKVQVIDALESLEGDFAIEIPPYSSFTIKGKPLFWWAREGRLDEISMPKKSMNILRSMVVKIDSISSTDLKEEIVRRVGRVEGDFRQDAIIEKWEEVISSSQQNSFPLVRAKFQCSSGTYIRSLVNELSQRVGLPTVLFNLVRTRIGLPDIDSQEFWAGDAIRVERLQK